MDRIEPGPLGERRQHLGREVGGVDAGQAAVATSDRATYRSNDYRITHESSLLAGNPRSKSRSRLSPRGDLTPLTPAGYRRNMKA
ncbi:hypothetical protein Afil01_60650 [Actinorhabdospora filicis]|uniref:Uncharacterized protein n=1 Tax=Actinorhabdospora filicis TaxID=1785913 RepID=A0A9W6SRY4_9ACTN|nr:hypothetical protein Afil01_60650 [Actinorhabdospora filicis]